MEYSRTVILAMLVEVINKYYVQEYPVRLSDFVFDSPLKGFQKSKINAGSTILQDDFNWSALRLIINGNFGWEINFTDDIPVPLMTWENLVDLIIENDKKFINSL
jgi:hypothetical protein